MLTVLTQKLRTVIIQRMKMVRPGGVKAISFVGTSLCQLAINRCPSAVRVHPRQAGLRSRRPGQLGRPLMKAGQPRHFDSFRS
jgi:hypothetical protein